MGIDGGSFRRDFELVESTGILPVSISPQLNGFLQAGCLLAEILAFLIGHSSFPHLKRPAQCAERFPRLRLAS